MTERKAWQLWGLRGRVSPQPDSYPQTREKPQGKVAANISNPKCGTLKETQQRGQVRVAAAGKRRLTEWVQYWFCMCSRNRASKVKHESENQKWFPKGRFKAGAGRNGAVGRTSPDLLVTVGRFGRDSLQRAPRFRWGGTPRPTEAVGNGIN